MLRIGEYWIDTKKRILEVLDVAENPYKNERQVIFRIVGQESHLVMSSSLFEKTFSRLKIINPPMDFRIKTFNRLFGTRRDVYAIRWLNKESKTWNYSPARDYNTRSLLPLTDKMISQHLSGNKFIGLYPLMPNDRTNFLVLDIDKKNWREIVPAIHAVLKELSLESYTEISQSGNGAHQWLFFSDSILAVYARQFGQLIINRAMQLNPKIDFDAFDRMLPHQDTMPLKGFGNLIAAPLQGERMALGRSVFVDANLVPYENQWEFLAGVNQISELQLRDLIEQLRNIIDSVMLATPLEHADISFTLSNNLEIDLEDVSDLALQQLRNLVTFPNPEYFKLIRARRSVYKTPRFLSFAKFTGDKLLLPRGLFRELITNYQVHKIVDVRGKGRAIKAMFNGTLYPEQQQALEGALEVQEGILVARTGFGKTVVSAALIAERRVSTLIVVPKSDLGNQWHRELERFLTIEDEPEKSYTPSGRERKQTSKIGKWFAQKRTLTGLVDIITIQALAQMDNLKDFYTRYGMIIFDEVHHNAALTYDQAVEQVTSKYLYGLTATFSRSDDMTELLNLRFGQVVFESTKVETTTLLTVKRTVRIEHTSFGFGHPELEESGFTQLNEEIIHNEARNKQIVNQILQYNQRTQIVLVNRVAHADILEELLQNTGVRVFVITGKLNARVRESVLRELKYDKKPYVLIATGSIAGEGLDLPDLTLLHLTTPRSFAGTIAQYLGRLERELSEKSELTVIDYADVNIPMLSRMYLKRLKTYRALFYDVIDEAHENH